MSRPANNNWVRLCAVAMLALFLSACGSGTSAGGSSTGTFSTGDGLNGGPGGGDFLDGINPLDMQGGVLAAFTVGNESFRAFVRDPFAAQELVDAFDGTGIPVTTICTVIQAGAGQGNHNQPWNWSISSAFPPNFTGLCVGCASAWSSPSVIENNLASGAPFNCKPAPNGTSELSLPGPIPPNPGPTRYIAFMQVTLVNVQDFR